MQCGLDHGDCHDPACCFSGRYDRAASLAAHEARQAAKEASNVAE
jgi:hypothetical protein